MDERGRSPELAQITSGFVPHMSDGTVGACRPPFPTLHDAAEWANRVNAQERARYTAHGLAYPEKRDECRQLAERIPTFHTTPAAA